MERKIFFLALILCLMINHCILSFIVFVKFMEQSPPDLHSVKMITTANQAMTIPPSHTNILTEGLSYIINLIKNMYDEGLDPVSLLEEKLSAARRARALQQQQQQKQQFSQNQQLQQPVIQLNPIKLQQQQQMMQQTPIQQIRPSTESSATHSVITSPQLIQRVSSPMIYEDQETPKRSFSLKQNRTSPYSLTKPKVVSPTVAKISPKASSPSLFKPDNGIEAAPAVETEVKEEIPFEEAEVFSEVKAVDGTFVPVNRFSGLFSSVAGGHMCNVCGFQAVSEDDICLHIASSHKDWPHLLLDNTSQQARGNVHNNPDWLPRFKNNFFFEIVSKLSQQTREAWVNNEKISDNEKFVTVRKEILQALVNKIVCVYGTVSTPNHKVLSEVVSGILAPGYPFMFSAREGGARAMGHGDKAVGYAKGGLKGVADLPKQLWGQIFKKQIALKKEANPSREEDDTEENVPARRRGKKGPYKYGIDNYLFYQVCSEEERSVYLASEDVSDVDLREQLYSESRGAIAESIRSSGNLLTRVVRGFFESTIHLHRQFLYFTSEGTELLPRIEANWSQQVLHMESYLKKVSNQ